MSKYFKQYIIKTISTVIVIIISSFISVAGAFIMSGMVNASMAGNEALLKQYLLGAVIYLLVFVSVGKVDNYLQNSLIKDINLSLRNGVFSAIIRGNRTDFYRRTVGEYMSVITNDVDMIANAYVGAVLSITGTLITIVVAIASIIYINASLFFGAVIIGLVYLAITSRLSKNLSLYKEQWKKTLEEYTEKVKDLLCGYEVITDFDLQDKSVEIFEKTNSYTGEQKKRLSINVDNLSNINYIIGQAIVIFIVFISSYLVTINQISIGELIAIVQLLVTIISPLQEMAGCINELLSIRKIKDELIGKILKQRSIGNVGCDEEKLAWEPLNMQESDICLEDVSFAYEGGRKIFEHLNIKLEQGKKYAIIGESGTGKSSLIGLLMNYFENYQGKITLNGIDYKKLDKSCLSKLFAIVHQNVILFDGTINDNITLFQNKDAEEVKEVIENACLDGVAKKKGLESILSENGTKLSGGEKQRIAIARALLMKRKILVLDEATSALDEDTAVKVMTNILGVQGQTCIAILHYMPKAIKSKFDCIYKLENGRLSLVDNY